MKEPPNDTKPRAVPQNGQESGEPRRGSPKHVKGSSPLVRAISAAKKACPLFDVLAEGRSAGLGAICEVVRQGAIGLVEGGQGLDA